jgi:hypothetical protein
MGVFDALPMDGTSMSAVDLAAKLDVDVNLLSMLRSVAPIQLIHGDSLADLSPVEI